MPLLQEGDALVPRDPDVRPPHAPGRALQARRVRGHQGRHQVLELVSAHCRLSSSSRCDTLL